MNFQCWRQHREEKSPVFNSQEWFDQSAGKTKSHWLRKCPNDSCSLLSVASWNSVRCPTVTVLTAAVPSTLAADVQEALWVQGLWSWIHHIHGENCHWLRKGFGWIEVVFHSDATITSIHTIIGVLCDSLR